VRLDAALDEEERRVRKGLWCMSGEEWRAMPEQAQRLIKRKIKKIE
jgi:hypothetical protein